MVNNYELVLHNVIAKTRAAASFLLALMALSGCVHARWPAKVLADNTVINVNPVSATVDQLRALPRPAGVDGLDAPRVPAERQIYRVRAKLLRFKLANDGDIHLAIAQPDAAAHTMIAEIPDPARMPDTSAHYRIAVSQARSTFIRLFGTPSITQWRPANRQIELIGPLLFDFVDGQVGGLAAGVATGVEIHPVLAIRECAPC